MPYRTDGVTPLGAQISSKQLELIREKELRSATGTCSHRTEGANFVMQRGYPIGTVGQRDINYI